MSIHYKEFTLTVLFILLTACTNTEPVTTPNTSTTPSASPTLAPQVVEATAVSEPTASLPTPTSEPAGGDITFIDSGQRLGAAQSWDVALGDLDGDDDLDAFVANAALGGAKNTVWLNDGQGSFARSEQILDYGQGVALGDLDGDGDLDAVTTHWWGKNGAQSG